MSRSMVLAVTCGALALLSAAVAALFFVERPTVITVAVPAESQSDRDLLKAASTVVRHGHDPIRFRIVTTEDAKAAAASLDNGAVDMAVARSDGPLPASGQTVVILHRDAAILVASGSSELKDVADLAGHTVGVVDASAADRGLLETVLTESDVPVDSVKVVPLSLEQIGPALNNKQADAILVVGIVSGPKVQAAVRAVAQTNEAAPVFIAIDEAEAIAQRSPVYEKLEIVKGAFRGKPPRPAEDFDTVSLTHRLMASSAMSQTVVADVTRFFLSERAALLARDPLARAIEQPPTEKGAALPAHAGSAAYIDDEEESFLDRYSDFFYLGAMLLGVLASVGTAIFSRLSAQSSRSADLLTARLIEILKVVRFAPSIELINALETETDEIVAAALDQNNARSLDERRLGALGLALNQVREAIRDRRAWLGAGEQAAGRPDRRPVHALVAD